MLHGGEIKSISDKYNIQQNQIIDFSGNINSISISNYIKDIIINNIDVINTYPDKNYYDLRKEICNYCNNNINININNLNNNISINNIIVGNGATEIITLLIKNLNPKKAVLVAPVYSEYKKELLNINCNIIEFELLESENFNLNISRLLDVIQDDTDLLILCNPNNPTGNAINTDQIQVLLDNCKFLMIDETYVEFSENNIYATNLVNNNNNLFVIRGVSKFFGIPGIRLGYGICSNDEIVKQINNNKEQWSVNAYADLIGQVTFSNKEYITNTREFIIKERNYMIQELREIKNIKVYESESNFVLCKILNKDINSSKVFDELIKHKILIRDAQNIEFLDDSFFRFCILSHQDNELLLDNLRRILK